MAGDKNWCNDRKTSIDDNSVNIGAMKLILFVKWSYGWLEERTVKRLNFWDSPKVRSVVKRFWWFYDYRRNVENGLGIRSPQVFEV